MRRHTLGLGILLYSLFAAFCLLPGPVAAASTPAVSTTADTIAYDG
jgi:hypothetical protein